MTLEPRVSPRRQYAALLILCLSLVLIVMDNTIVNVALPVIARDLHAGTASLQWIVDAYALTMTPLLLLGGRIGDRFGRRRAWQVGLILFAASSVVAAVSPGVAVLIVARGAMGVGAALVMPGTLSLLVEAFHEKQQRAKAIAIWAASTGVGVVLGPVVGGALLDRYWWGSVFLINVAVALALLVIAPLAVPHGRAHARVKLNPISVALSAVGIGALLWATIEAPDRGWGNPAILGAMALALAVLAVYIRRDLRLPEPLLDLRLFKDSRFAASASAIAVAFFVLFGSVFLLTQYLQLIHGYSPLAAGLRTVPFALAVMFAAGNAPKLVQLLSLQRTVAFGLLLLSGGAMLLSLLQTSTAYPKMLPCLLLLGAGVGWTMAPCSDAIMARMPEEQMGVGASVNDVARELGGALGVAVIGSVSVAAFRSNVITHHEHLRSLADAISAPAHSQGLVVSPSAGQAFVVGMHVGANVAAGVALAAVIVSVIAELRRGQVTGAQAAVVAADAAP